MKFLKLKTSYSIGQSAEKKAIKFLSKANWQILEHNFKTALGEIDIIASKNHTLVAFEVKCRNDAHTLPHSISVKQQLRIEQALLLYLQRNPQFINYNIRFDAILIYHNSMQHIESAWLAKE